MGEDKRNARVGDRLLGHRRTNKRRYRRSQFTAMIVSIWGTPGMDPLEQSNFLPQATTASRRNAKPNRRQLIAKLIDVAAAGVQFGGGLRRQDAGREELD